jgi:hypothetical protein
MSEDQSPLFMLNSQIQPTQAYNAFPSSLSVEAPAPAQAQANGGVNGTQSGSPVEKDGVEVGSDGEGDSGGEDDDDDDDDDDGETTTTIPPITTRIYPTLPRPSASQPTSSFTGLSALPRELLRQGSNFSASQPVKAKSRSLLNGDGDGEGDGSSESGSESSEEEVGDKRAKGRYANGKGKRGGKLVPAKRGW